MKILVIHNNYLEIGGEDIAVQNEIKNLKDKHEVKELIFSNKINNYFIQSIYFLLNKNFKSKKLFENELKEFQPDIVYIHNTWFMASLEIFKISKKYNIKTLIKLHNFRYNCTKSISSSVHLNSNKFCPACGFSKNKFNFNFYYPRSLIKSILVLWYGKKYFKILKDPYYKIAVLTNFHKDFLKKLGFTNNIFVFPNYLKPEKIEKSHTNNEFILYAGRISSEKGVSELLEAFQSSKLSNLKLKIIGEGPLASELSKFQNIEYLGKLTNKEVLNEISSARAVVSATKLLEGQPNLLCEASMLGVPSIFPKTGGIEEFFPNNYPLSFEQFNYEDLIKKLELTKDKNFVSNIGNQNKIFINTILNKKKLEKIFEEMVIK